jgi:hypothetical protein
LRICYGLIITIVITFLVIPQFHTSSAGPSADSDGDGRPDDFEIWQGLDENENDVEWTFLVYCCGDDVPEGNKTGTILPEMWEFVEKLSWVGSTDNINIVVQFDGSDQLNGNHQDMFWNDIPNNRKKEKIEGTTTRRFLVGKDTRGWDPSIILDDDCTNNTLVDLYDVTDWDPENTGKSHSGTWEANMADPYTFHEFISWGMDTFPSDNYCLYVDSHGDGVFGFGYDHRTDSGPTHQEKDLLTLDDIGIVSDLMEEEDKKIDIVMLQSCLMGNMEFNTEFMSFCDHYVASENLMHITGNQDDKVLENLEREPSWSSERLVREFIDIEYHYSRDGIANPPWNIMDWDGRERLTISCINNSFLRKEDIFTLIDEMNRALLDGIEIDPGWYVPNLKYSLSRLNTDHYTSDLGYLQIDYPYFLDYWTDVEGTDDEYIPVIRNLSREIGEILWNSDPSHRGIEYEKHDLSYFQRTRGIAVYCPAYLAEWRSIIEEYSRSGFTEDTSWNSVIDVIHANLPPILKIPERIKFYPGELVLCSFDATDLNGDRVELSIEETNAPFEIMVADHLSIALEPGMEDIGVHSISVAFDDGNGSRVIRDVFLEVMPFNIPPSIDDIPPVKGHPGKEMILELNITDPNPGDQLSVWSESEIQCDIWIDEGFRLHIMPDQVERGLVSIFVSDNNGSIVNISFDLDISVKNHPPTGPESISLDIRAGERALHNFRYSDLNSDVLTLEGIAGLPDWLSVSFEDELIVGMEPSNGDVGVWEFPLHLTDEKGGGIGITLEIQVLPPIEPHLILSEEISVREREELILKLESDYMGSGAVHFELLRGWNLFIRHQGEKLLITPRDGDHGTYSLRIRTSVVGGGFSVSEHVLEVQRNLSTLEVRLSLGPDKETYFPGDIIRIRLEYLGYGLDLDLSICILDGGRTIVAVNDTYLRFTPDHGSDLTIMIGQDGDFLPDTYEIKVREAEKEEENSILSPMVAVSSILGLGIIIFLGIITRSLLGRNHY